MSKIAMDMSPLVYGSRAVKRCTMCMAQELIKDESIRFKLFYIDYKHQKNKYLSPLNDRTEEHVFYMPYRVLIPLWRRFSWPTFERHFSECDALYTNEFYFPPTRKTTVLATVHGLAYKVIPGKIPLPVVASLSKGLSYVLRHADYLLAVSETTRKELVGYVGVDPGRVYVVTHGVDRRFRRRRDRQAAESRLKKTYGLNRPFILYVGAVGIHKNIKGILSAYESLSRDIDRHLVLAGPPDSAWDSARRFVNEKGLSASVHFLGHVHDTESLVDLYNCADLFVFPSFYEGWTSPPLEAMACGTPVITSNCSSLPETVGNAAITVDPDDIPALAREIKSVLCDRTLKNELMHRGLEHAAVHTWEKAARKLRDVFADVRSRGPWKKQI